MLLKASPPGGVKFISWKFLWKNGWSLGVPPWLWKPQICINIYSTSIDVSVLSHSCIIVYWAPGWWFRIDNCLSQLGWRSPRLFLVVVVVVVVVVVFGDTITDTLIFWAVEGDKLLVNAILRVLFHYPPVVKRGKGKSPVNVVCWCREKQSTHWWLFHRHVWLLKGNHEDMGTKKSSDVEISNSQLIMNGPYFLSTNWCTFARAKWAWWSTKK